MELLKYSFAKMRDGNAGRQHTPWLGLARPSPALSPAPSTKHRARALCLIEGPGAFRKPLLCTLRSVPVPEMQIGPRLRKGGKSTINSSSDSVRFVLVPYCTWKIGFTAEMPSELLASMPDVLIARGLSTPPEHVRGRSVDAGMRFCTGLLEQFLSCS